MRDLKAVGKKFVHVMYPKKSSALLRDCTYKKIFKILKGYSANRLSLHGKRKSSVGQGFRTVCSMFFLLL